MYHIKEFLKNDIEIKLDFSLLQNEILLFK